jgi:hypothetical protein
VDGADDSVQARQVFLDLAPHPVDAFGVGDQHDPAGEDRLCEHPPVEQPPAQNREGRDRHPDEDGWSRHPIGRDEEDDKQSNRLKCHRSGDDTEYRPHADCGVEVVSVHDQSRRQPDDRDQSHTEPGNRQRGVLDRS